MMYTKADAEKTINEAMKGAKRLKIKPLNEDLIYIANYNSYNGEVGNVMRQTYIICAENIIRWSMAEEQKQALLDELYNKWTVELANEVMGVRV